MHNSLDRFTSPYSLFHSNVNEMCKALENKKLEIKLKKPSKPDNNMSLAARLTKTLFSRVNSVALVKHQDIVSSV